MKSYMYIYMNQCCKGKGDGLTFSLVRGVYGWLLTAKINGEIQAIALSNVG